MLLIQLTIRLGLVQLDQNGPVNMWYHMFTTVDPGLTFTTAVVSDVCR